SHRVAAEVERSARRQSLSSAYVVIQKKTETQQPARTQARLVRQDKPQRTDEMRSTCPDAFAFAQRLPHEPEFVMFEIAQAAVDQLRGPGRGSTGEVPHLYQQDLEIASRRVARDAAAVYAATDDQDVILGLTHGCPPCTERI